MYTRARLIDAATTVAGALVAGGLVLPPVEVFAYARERGDAERPRTEG